jgi:hypothetical protein
MLRFRLSPANANLPITASCSFSAPIVLPHQQFNDAVCSILSVGQIGFPEPRVKARLEQQYIHIARFKCLIKSHKLHTRHVGER